ncbi:MAG: hypothetical protein ACFFCS_29840, partial [Candidatus Hodarchaeota archaeon]
APILASLSIYFISYLFSNVVWSPLLAAVGLIPAALITVLWMLVGTLGIYMFFYGFFGGFDDFGMKVMDQATEISGPSKPLIKFLRAFLKMGIRISPLHNKFPIPSEDAERESLELMVLRERNELKTIDDLKKK